MSKLYFYTPTTLDEAFIFTMGASVKKTKSPIGFFGTGLKYAIAVTLRLGGSITIESSDPNMHKIAFHSRSVELRGEKMQLIDAIVWRHPAAGELPTTKQCPMTTDYGKTWEPWMVMRELWSNTQDENGITWDRESLVETDLHEEWTLITVDCEEVYDAWQDKRAYLLDLTRKPLYENSTVQVFSGKANSLFYRGICVADVKTAFTYNFLSLGHNSLSENRTIDASNVRSTISYAMTQCTDEIILDRYFEAACTLNTYESTIPFNYWSLVKETTQEYADAAVAAVKDNIITAPSALKEAVWEYKKNYETESFYKPVVLNAEMSKRYIRIKTQMHNVGFDLSLFKVYFTKDMPADQYGAAFSKTQTIVLNINKTLAHDNWQKQTMCSLIEEYIHLTYEVRDESRGMQEAYNEAIYMLITMGRIDKKTVKKRDDLDF
jgi:hypothetical protein